MSTLRKMNFTRHDDPLINKTIAEELQQILSIILKKFDDVEAIMLSGGFGKGEGSIKQMGNKVVPLNDFDILVVTRKPHFNTNFHDKELTKKLKLYPGFHLDITLFWKPLLRFVGKKVSWYDIKFGSKILYGNRRILDLIPLKENENLSITEGVRLQFWRMVGLIEFFDPNTVKVGCKDPQAKLLIYQSVKAILACCESLLLLKGKWKLNIDERCKTFIETFSKEFTNLAFIDPDLPRAVTVATSFKLFPRFDIFPDEIDLWFNARKHLENAIKFLWEEYRNLEIKSRSDFIRTFLNHSNFSVLDYVLYHIRFFKKTKRVCLRAIPLRMPPLDLLFIVVYLLLTSVNRRGDVDLKFLEIAENMLQMLHNFKTINITDKTARWCHLRDEVFQVIEYLT